MLKLPHNCTSHVSKVMLKILQARLYSMWTENFHMDLEKTGIRDQVANLHWIIEKAMKFQKENIYFCFMITMGITTNCGKLWKKY